MENTALAPKTPMVETLRSFVGVKRVDKVVKRENIVKPIGMFFSDGGPDENPRFPKTSSCSILRNKIWMCY